MRAAVERSPYRLPRAVGAWYDAEPDGRSVVVLLALFVLLWSAFQLVAYAPIGLHSDPLETFAWSRHPSLGYYKHPPLGALIAAAWFAIFPRADWSFQLLSSVNAALALAFVYLIARRTLEGDKRLFVLLLLMLTPFYQFNAQRFASNQTLLSLWPIATYCFLRSFETRAVETRASIWAAAAGATAALTVLGKYFSVYLVAGFIAAALAHPRRRDYLRAPAPWISIAVGLTVLAPHVYWLVTTGFQPFAYALGAHGGASLRDAINAALYYAVGGALYMALPFAAYWLAVRPDVETLREAFWPADPDRRLLAVILYVSLGLPMLTAPLLRSELVPLWTQQGWFLLPILWLAPARAVLPRRRAMHVALAVLVMNLAVLLAAPVLAWTRWQQDPPDDRVYFRDIAAETTRLWHETAGRRLRIVMGNPNFATAATFYSADVPDSVPGFDLKTAPWITEQRLDDEGFAVICRATETACIGAAQARIAARTDARRVEVEITPRFLGTAGPPERFLLILVPPAPKVQVSLGNGRLEPD